MVDEKKIKHLLLEKIVELKKTQVSKLSSLLDLSIGICYSLCEEISNEGYIHFRDASSKGGKDAIITINGKGEIFSQNGGYKRAYDEFKKEEQDQKRTRTLSNVSIIILILTSISTLILAVFAYFQNNKINDLEEQLRSNNNPNFKKELVGKWDSYSKNDTSSYIFNEDNTWQFILLSMGEKIIYKGEFQIGKENGVFLRHYGSVHWGHDSTYNDIKSGLGASYLYLVDDRLINNQEDYTSVYIKQK